MLAIACNYIRNGWAPVPVPYRQKGPVIKDWPALRLNEQTAPKYFANGPVNIGVILGAASGGLADIDLDCAEALAVAAAVLPPTLRFGRPSTRAAHWIYRTSFPAGTKAAITFDDPVKLRGDPKAARLLELRTGAGNRAAQTVFPGSVHESGEPITWEDDGSATPATIMADELTAHATRIAALSLLVRYWPPKGNRHDLSLAIGGMLARGGWDDAAIKNFVGVVVHGANDPRPGDRVRCALDAAASGGRRATGLRLSQVEGAARRRGGRQARRMARLRCRLSGAGRADDPLRCHHDAGGGSRRACDRGCRAAGVSARYAAGAPGGAEGTRRLWPHRPYCRAEPDQHHRNARVSRPGSALRKVRQPRQEPGCIASRRPTLPN